MSIAVRAVENRQEAEAVYRLRYQIYVEELGRTQRYADHAARMIQEPLDACARLWGAFEGERVVGTVRTNYAADTALGEYLSVYQMDRLDTGDLAATSVTTKLLVGPEYRNTSLGWRLAVAAYRTALRDGIRFDLIDVYPPRIPFFERLGYRTHVPEAEHSEYGRVVVMKLDLRDAAHLRLVGSPFLKHLDPAGREPVQSQSL